MRLLSSLCHNRMIYPRKNSRQMAVTSLLRGNCRSNLDSAVRLLSTSNSDGLVHTLTTKFDWEDRIGLQSRLNLEEKGWLVPVDWRSTPYGAGLFAKQDIPAGTLIRRGVLGINQKEFTSIQDIEDFCKLGNEDEYRARLEYVKDYLFAFSKDTDETGYESNSSDEDNRFFGMWIPGNGMNHNEDSNIVYKATKNGIDVVASVDIQADDELFDDYRRHGTSPPWLKEFANLNKVTLTFADCNDFV